MKKQWKLILNNCTCHYFDEIIKLKGFYFGRIVIYEKLHENILVYDISYKTLIGARPFHIRFDKVDGFVRYLVYD